MSIIYLDSLILQKLISLIPDIKDILSLIQCCKYLYRKIRLLNPTFRKCTKSKWRPEYHYRINLNGRNEGICTSSRRGYFTMNTYKDGICEGKYMMKKFNILVESGQYKNNRKEGKWVYFSDRTQRKIAYEHYSNGKKNGPLRIFYADGRVNISCYYKDGMLHGEFTHYLDNNKIVNFYYDNGKILLKKNLAVNMITKISYLLRKPYREWSIFDIPSIPYISRDIFKILSKYMKKVSCEKRVITCINNIYWDNYYYYPDNRHEWPLHRTYPSSISQYGTL